VAAEDIKALLERATAHLGDAAVVSLDELRARRGAVESLDQPQWKLSQLTGRLVEVSAIGPSAVLTAAVDRVLQAQVEGEPVAWITPVDQSFYPPDLADSGVDLDALVVVRSPSSVASSRACERLLRSGAFGLVVVDAGADAQLSTAHQGRLVALAQQHDAAVVYLTEKNERQPSLGSLVSLRVEAVRERVDGGYRLAARALKDKRRGPGWIHHATLLPPAGLK
jgi:recombination protein RecA